jgi:hypothetical protein
LWSLARRCGPSGFAPIRPHVDLLCWLSLPPGSRKNDLTIYWALGPFVRSFTLLVDPGDIYPPQCPRRARAGTEEPGLVVSVGLEQTWHHHCRFAWGPKPCRSTRTLGPLGQPIIVGGRACRVGQRWLKTTTRVPLEECRARLSRGRGTRGHRGRACRVRGGALGRSHGEACGRPCYTLIE